jgi:hypothetical protein
MQYNPNFRNDKEVKYRADLYKRDDILAQQVLDKRRFDVPFTVSGKLGIERYQNDTSTYAVKGQIEQTPLVVAFFSKANMQIIQNGIRKRVHDKTREIISEQNERILHTIMRAIFFQQGVYLSDCVTDQIIVLNELVLGTCVMQIIEAMGMDKYYLEHAFDNPLPMENQGGVNISVRGRNTLEFNTF